METFGGLLVSKTPLSGQNDLIGSPWSNTVALDSNADLTDVLSTIQSTVDRGAFKVELEKLADFDVEAGFNSSAPNSRDYIHTQTLEMAHGSATGDSRAVDTSSLFRQSVVPTTAVEPNYNREAIKESPAQDSLTGIAEGAALVGDVSRATNISDTSKRNITDLNQDNYSDIVWHNSATGKNVVWLMQGAKIADSAPLASVSSPKWHIGGISHTPNLGSDFTQINWSTAAPSPIGRSEALGAAVDGKLYVLGGYINTTYTPTRRSDVYDPVSNTWRRIKDLPKGLTHTGVAVDEVNNDIYLAGGYIESASGTGQTYGTKNVWKYDVETDTWTTMPSLPQIRASGELSLLNGKLHFFGGTNIKRTQDVGNHWVLSLNGGTSWTRAAPLPNPRTHMGDAVIGGKIYAIGGQHEHDEDLVTQNSVHEYNPVTNQWKAVASMPKALSHISSTTFVMDGRVIVVGGETDHGDRNTVADVTAYDPASNSWTALTPLPAARRSGVARSIGNQIFYTTGSPSFKTTTYRGVPAN